MTLDELIKSNIDYITILEARPSLGPVSLQYLDIARDSLIHLQNLKKGIPFPRNFYRSLIDSFDISSDFFSNLSSYLEANPNHFSS